VSILLPIFIFQLH